MKGARENISFLMNANHHALSWLRFPRSLALFACALFTLNAESADPLALNQPEQLIGTWKAIGGSMGEALTLSFSGKGDFRMLLTSKGGQQALGEGTYTVHGTQWPMRISAVAGGKQISFGIAVLPNDLIVVWLADSDDEPLDPKNATLLLRQSATPGTSSSEKSKPVELQKRQNLIGTWKHPDLKVSMSFSEAGEYELRNEKNDKTTVVKGSYTVTRPGNSLIVQVTFDGGKDYYSIALLSMDRFAWQQLKSPQDAPDPEKAVVWLRER